MNSRVWRSLAIYALLIFVMISLADLFTPSAQLSDLDYNTFLGYVETGRVASVTIIDETSVEGKLKDGTEFRTIVPGDPDLYGKLVASGAQVKFELPPEPSWWISLASKDPSLYGRLVLHDAALGGSKQVMQFGKSRARLQSDAHEKVTFQDVAGCDEAKEELQEVVDFLKHAKKMEMGARILRGSLFGPPEPQDLHCPGSSRRQSAVLLSAVLTLWRCSWRGATR